MRKVLLFVFASITNLVCAQTWNQKTDFTGCSYDGVAFAIGNDVYYGLGILCNGGETQNFHKFNTLTNSWSAIAAFPGPTRRKASAFAINGKGYVCLGYSNGVDLQDLWEYDPVMNTWTAKANFGGPARGTAVADVVNGKAYVGSGFSPMFGYPMDFWEYNPVTDAWTIKDTMPGIALYAAQSFAIGDTMYVIGGVGGINLLEHNEFWAYSASANTWTQNPDFPGGTPRWYATTFSLNGRGYCGYGMVGTTYVGDFHSYDPAAGIWAVIPSNGLSMLFNGGGGGVATSTAGYCISGVTYSNPSPASTDMWEFDPATTGINAALNNSSEKILITPNPANDFIIIKSNIEGEFIIVNSFGQTIKKINLKSNEPCRLDVSNLKNGIYFLKSKFESSVNQKKIIIN